MKMKMNNVESKGARISKKLLATIAVLAVAFVVFAAIPAVDAEGRCLDVLCRFREWD